MIAVVKDEEIQRIGYYAAIPATVLFNERLKPNEKLLYALITALSNKEGYCYASNKYLGEKLGVDPVTVSRWITDLRRNNYVFVDIMRNEKKEIICRRIFPNDVPYRLNNQYPYILQISTDFFQIIFTAVYQSCKVHRYNRLHKFRRLKLNYRGIQPAS